MEGLSGLGGVSQTSKHKANGPKFLKKTIIMILTPWQAERELANVQEEWNRYQTQHREVLDEHLRKMDKALEIEDAKHRNEALQDIENDARWSRQIRHLGKLQEQMRLAQAQKDRIIVPEGNYEAPWEPLIDRTHPLHHQYEANKRQVFDMNRGQTKPTRRSPIITIKNNPLGGEK